MYSNYNLIHIPPPHLYVLHFFFTLSQYFAPLASPGLNIFCLHPRHRPAARLPNMRTQYLQAAMSFSMAQPMNDRRRGAADLCRPIRSVDGGGVYLMARAVL